VRELYYSNEKEITDLLMFRKIVKVENDTLFLDNGVELEIVANEGCGGCSAGWYSVTELNSCDNAITNVEFACDSTDEDYNEDYSYKIFVYAEDQKIKILQVDGSDGNGYYGTGYSINVKVKNN
jgi:hypothetical protein